MKTLCIMDSVSRANGGIFEAERRLQQTLLREAQIDVQVVGLRDAHSDSDLPAWLPLMPQILPTVGPQAFGFAPGLTDALTHAGADLGYMVGLWKYPSVAALRWSKQTGKPVMVAPHGMLDKWALQNSALKKTVAGWLFQNELLRRAACMRALCGSEMRSIREYGLKAPICVIPNGIDLPVPDETYVPRARLFPAGKKGLLYLGRIHPKKGLANLIAAWGAQTIGKDWLLAIAGWDQGGHEAELQKQASDLGISWNVNGSAEKADASVTFLGPQFGLEKAACYHHCDAFILPSFSEGLPMVVLEAWSHAKPVLMTPQCNLPEGFAADSALKIDPTAESISAGLGQLFAMSDADREAMGKRGLSLVQDRFTWPKVAAQMHSVYEWMLGGGTKPACMET